MADTKVIVFGGGCFWCTEAVFAMLKGVVKTTAGYAGGNTSNPTYEEVSHFDTGHAEVLKIEYDPEIISISTLLDVFFEMHDPTSLNRQGADVGTQYRSAIFYTTTEDKDIISRFIEKSKTRFDKPIVTEVKRLDRFYTAEEYHQRYYEKNTEQPYCTFVITPKIKKIMKEFAAKIKQPDK